MNQESFQHSPDNAESGFQPFKKWKICVMALSTIPFAIKFAYLNRAWVSSPVDRARLGLWGSGVLLIAVLTTTLKLIYRFPTDKPTHESRALRILPIPIVLYLAGILLDFNALQLIASVGIAWATAWMLYGRVVGALLSLATVMAILAVPGSSYWLGKASSAFVAPIRTPCHPTFSARSQQGYLGYEIPANAAFTRFFQTSDAHQFRYASKSNEVSVLSVRVGSDIHEIHPATHCLRSSGWKVECEELRDITMTSRKDPLSVTEAVVSNAAGSRLVMWVWYSSPAESTGSFIRFRRLQASGAPWQTFQLTTQLDRTDDLTSARQKLRTFLESGKDAS